MASFTEKLNTRLSELSLMDRQNTQIYEYVDYLLKVNKKVSLTRVGDFDSWFTAHVEDSIKSYSHFRALNLESFVDCGSGNGLPGVIFAILSGLPFTLCDIDQRKCEFLKSAIYKLKLKGAVFCGPIDDLPVENTNNHAFIYRGLGPDPVLLEHFKKRRKNTHFRFVSSGQTSLFEGSQREKYILSDKSLRELEIYL